MLGVLKPIINNKINQRAVSALGSDTPPVPQCSGMGFGDPHTHAHTHAHTYAHTQAHTHTHT